jgi:hypothetical protein
VEKMLKIRAEINEIETNKQYKEKLFFEKVNKIAKP